MLIVIDNFALLRENYEPFLDASVIPLVRRSLAAGISFVVATNGPTNLPGRLLAHFGEQITFRQNNPDRYLDIVGRGRIGDRRASRGRGYVRVSMRPMLFQAALPVGACLASTAATNGPRRTSCGCWPCTWLRLPDPGRSAQLRTPLRSCRDRFVEGHARKRAPPAPGRIAAVLGKSVSLEPALVDLKRTGLHFMISGPPVSGKTTTLTNFARCRWPTATRRNRPCWCWSIRSGGLPSTAASAGWTQLPQSWRGSMS